MHKVVIKGNYYGRTRTLPDLNDYLHECARHPQMGAKMKRDYQMIACNAIRTQLPRLTINNPIIIHYRFYEPDKQRDKGNIFAFADKVFEDALQKCGVIKKCHRGRYIWRRNRKRTLLFAYQRHASLSVFNCFALTPRLQHEKH